MATEVTLSGDALELPGGVRITFIRTLRLPETGTYPLPPGLGVFPLRRVADYADTVPDEWRRRGGVMLPVYQREAMWLRFSAAAPAALKVGVGKVCAVSGKPWSDELAQDPQNYLTLPEQPWMDGINSGDGTVRQFVAVPLGLGATVEGQVTGTEQWGGVQLAVHGLTDLARHVWDVAEEARKRRARAVAPTAPWPGEDTAYGAPLPVSAPGFGVAVAGGPPPSGAAPAQPGAFRPAARKMGLGAGGTMRQEIYADRRPLTDYRPDTEGRVFVHLASAAEWQQITGETAPPTPIDAQAYAQHNLPWFDYYDADAADLPAAAELAAVQPTGNWLADEQPNPPLEQPLPVIALGDAKQVADGDW
ncbi:hypothetical protein FEK33_14730 [Nocardia asteroides NBRC 15531]|uniref:Integral membrane protein n=1 Tax=Nocardia asteroides NBRC 15531 TaxID=1110697 RepID=U5E852_NOCAS|nr:hypothetical protein [Nocardia asteroides]TLF67232.1 hypothetical protein FEK33_14730 [Nocardia asteroides NBRC 15531]UGT51483.1 hypothetical protein LT345_13450 [Nocardia asteroides]SFM25586.1 hypothetical protein SAMN05444423_102410 [Nocardia asteroides]VEG35627.1 Uncharacterised protein [Nocardia asteroides]GAD86212.1 hypothetical protein NCAST_32_06990 [Nocardia asteroides NBRC 15531]